MPELKQRLQHDLTTSMKARDELTTATLRMALAAVMNAEVAGKQAVTLTDEQIVEVLRSEVKKRAEAAELYDTAGRTELAARERAETGVLLGYLPAALDDDALTAVVAEEIAVAAAAGATGPKAMGAVVKAVRARVGGGADGSRIAAAVKTALG